jgi:MFS family permease
MAPSLDMIAREFIIISSAERNVADHVTTRIENISSSVSHTQLILSTFVLTHAIGTLTLAPASELTDRRPVVSLSAIILLAFVAACSVVRSSSLFVMFLVLFKLGGCFALAVGAAIIGDTYSPQELGSAVTVYMGLQLAGPAVCPINTINVEDRSAVQQS